jgi:hypothetical protein
MARRSLRPAQVATMSAAPGSKRFSCRGGAVHVRHAAHAGGGGGAQGSFRRRHAWEGETESWKHEESATVQDKEKRVGVRSGRVGLCSGVVTAGCWLCWGGVKLAVLCLACQMCAVLGLGLHALPRTQRLLLPHA